MLLKTYISWFSKLFSSNKEYQKEYLFKISSINNIDTIDWEPLKEPLPKIKRKDINIKDIKLNIHNENLRTREQFFRMGYKIEHMLIDQLSKHYLILNKQQPYNTLKYEPISLYGRIDGIIKLDDNKVYLLEIKTRIHGFKNIDIVELNQIMLYMYLSGTRACLFIQVYNNEIKTEMVYYSKDYMKCLKNNIKSFITSIKT